MSSGIFFFNQYYVGEGLDPPGWLHLISLKSNAKTGKETSVILSEDLSESKNLRSYLLHRSQSVRRSFDSLRSLRMTKVETSSAFKTVRLGRVKTLPYKEK